MGKAFLLLWLLIFSGNTPDGETHFEAMAAKDRLTVDEAALLLKTWDQCPSSLKPRLRSVLSRGGPWLPALIDALPRSEPARELIRAAFAKRPMRYELPPPGEAATTEVDPFGNARTGEGVALDFPGTWPGPVKLSVFLERVNAAARPSYPLVLSPLVEDGTVEIKPLPGPAAFVIDSVLSRLDLGVTFLDTVALVSREGGSCYGQTRLQQKGDELLLDQAIDVLSSTTAAGEARTAALTALARLDPPGLFEGYYRELERGRLRPSLDLLLVGQQADRLRIRLIETGDRGVVAILVEIHLGRKLERFLETLPVHLLMEGGSDFVLDARCGRISHEAVLDRIDSSDPDRVKEGLRAARFLDPEAPGWKEALLSRLSAWPAPDRLVEALLVQTLSLDDSAAADLLLNKGTRTAGLMLAWNRGGDRCLEALLSLHDQGTGDAESVRCAARLVKGRREREILDQLCNEDRSPESRLLAAGVLVALGREEPAASYLMEHLATRNERAASLFSFFKGGRILPYLEALGRFGGAAGERAVLCAAQESVIAAERIRLALKSEEGNPLGKRLNDRLALLAMVSTRESYFVAVDF